MINDGYISLYKRRVYYRYINYDKDKPLLVFFHDALGSIRQWKGLPERLSEILSLPCLVYDRHGHGNSEQSPFEKRTISYIEDEAAICFPGLIKALAINQPLICIGHSDGASIALIISSLKGQEILATVTIAGHIFVEEVTLSGILEAKKQYEHTDLKTKLEKYHSGKAETLFFAWCNTWLAPFFRNWNIEKYLAGITCPVLVIQGSNDEYATHSHVTAIQKGLGGEKEYLIIPNCGHLVHKDQQAITISAISSFLQPIIQTYNQTQTKSAV